MNLFATFEDRTRDALIALQADGLLPRDANLSGFVVESPRDPSHGDLATNAAMMLAKPARLNPKELAAKIANKLGQAPDVERADVAGPGFINITVKPQVWPRVLRAVLTEETSYGRSSVGAGEPVNVEYVSTNPTGPVHVGHTRGAVFGDALCNLLDFAGFKATREYYINDGGGQVDVLARSAFLRYREALGEEIGDIPPGLYPGDYVKPVGEMLAKEFGKRLLRMKEETWLPKVRPIAIAAMMDIIRDDLLALGIQHEVFFSERSLSDGDTNEVADTIAELKEKGLVYQGRLPAPKGKLPDDWEDREQTLFRATEFGDDADRPLIKSDGSYTYFAPDMAYHRNKFRRGFRHMIVVLGADHGGYVKRLSAAVKALSDGQADVDVKLCQIVKLFKGGEPFKMSKRAGTFITARDLVDEVGPGPVRFMMLYRKNDAPLDFDFDKVLEQSNENPVFYVQYAHARASSVLSKAKDAYPDEDLSASSLVDADLSLLTDEAELAVIKKIAQYPRAIEAAALAHEPHRIAFFAHELAAAFHSLWTRGKELPHLRFMVTGSRDVTLARIALTMSVAIVLRSALSVMGIQAITEMR